MTETQDYFDPIAAALATLHAIAKESPHG